MDKSKLELNEEYRKECATVIWNALNDYGSKLGYFSIATTTYPLTECLFHFVRKHYPDDYNKKLQSHLKILEQTYEAWGKISYPPDYKV